jgi:hypothetical protein
MTPATTTEQDPAFSLQQQQQQGLQQLQQHGVLYGAGGLPVLPERLRLRMPPWTVPDNFPEGTSNFN